MDRTPTLRQKFLAELLGTAFLVWVGPGSITTTNFISGGKVPFTMAELGMIALAFAFAIAAMVYTIGHISGCHINPAVTLSFAVTRRIPWNEAAVYWGGQLIGAFLGAAFIGVCYGFTNAATIGYGATNFSDANTGYIVATAAELIGTFFLLLVIMGTAGGGRHFRLWPRHQCGPQPLPCPGPRRAPGALRRHVQSRSPCCLLCRSCRWWYPRCPCL